MVAVDGWIVGSLLGAGIGAVGLVLQPCSEAQGRPQHGDEPGPSGRDGEAPEPAAAEPSEAEAGSSTGRPRRLLRFLWPAVLLAAAAGTLAFRISGGWRLRPRGRQRNSQPRIPLKELVRFREKAWFVEELENAHDGDPNAMLRLAKMYFYGQGCQRSVNIAQEWLRRARSQGVYCTLDELLTAEDLDQMRRQLMRGGGGPRSAAAGLRPLAAGA